MRTLAWITANFWSVGSAMQPAVMAVRSGDAEERESSAQNSEVNAAAAAVVAAGEVEVAEKSEA